MNTRFDTLMDEAGGEFLTEFEDGEFFASFGQMYDSGGGANDYMPLKNKPKIEGNTVVGDKTFYELGLLDITPQEIDDIFDELIYGGT